MYDHSAKPQPQMFGQLPMERVIPDAVFNRVGVDYAGPVYIKYGYVRKPAIVKAYICVCSPIIHSTFEAMALMSSTHSTLLAKMVIVSSLQRFAKWHCHQRNAAV